MQKAGKSSSGRRRDGDSMSCEDEEWSSWEDVHKFATSFKLTVPSADPGKADQNRNGNGNFDRFIRRNEVEPFRGRGHMMLEMSFKDVRLMDCRTQRELDRANINMSDPDIDVIRAAAEYQDVISGPEPEEPCFERILPAKASTRSSLGQFDDAQSLDFFSPGKCDESSPRMLSDFHDETDPYVPLDTAAYRYSGDHPTVGQTAYDPFKCKIEESDFIQVDPGALHSDNRTPSPCSSPLPEGDPLEEIMAKTTSSPETDPHVPLDTATSDTSDHTPYYDAFTYKIDDSDYIKVDPISLGMDASALSPCSSPVPEARLTTELTLLAVSPLEEITPLSADGGVQKTTELDENPIAPPEPQLLPDVPLSLDEPESPEHSKLPGVPTSALTPDADRLRDFILSFKNALSDHGDILACFLDVVSAWTSDQIAFQEMEDKLTRMLSESFLDLLEGFLNFARDLEFPRVLVSTSVKPRRHYRNFVVMNYWKKEEQRRNEAKDNCDGKASRKDDYASIIRECVSQLRCPTEVPSEQVQTADAAEELDVDDPAFSDGSESNETYRRLLRVYTAALNPGRLTLDVD